MRDIDKAELAEFEAFWEERRQAAWRSTLGVNEQDQPMPQHWSAGFKRQTLVGWLAAKRHAAQVADMGNLKVATSPSGASVDSVQPVGSADTKVRERALLDVCSLLANLHAECTDITARGALVYAMKAIADMLRKEGA